MVNRWRFTRPDSFLKFALPHPVNLAAHQPQIIPPVLIRFTFATKTQTSQGLLLFIVECFFSIFQALLIHEMVAPSMTCLIGMSLVDLLRRQLVRNFPSYSLVFSP